MSYILDALRKADAERERGQVPDLHAQPVLRGSSLAEPGADARPWIWIAAAASIVALGSLAWSWLGRDALREPIASVAPSAATAPVPSAAVPAPAPAPAAAPAPAPTAVPAIPTTVAPARPTAIGPPPVEALRPAARKPVATPRAAKAEAPAAPAAPAAPVAPAARASEPRLYTVAELPDDIRRELPALAIGGAMYSENAANRMLIINGQVFHERDKLAPQLTLVQIKLKAAVLEFRGYRYSISY